MDFLRSLFELVLKYVIYIVVALFLVAMLLVSIASGLPSHENIPQGQPTISAP